MIVLQFSQLIKEAGWLTSYPLDPSQDFRCDLFIIKEKIQCILAFKLEFFPTVPETLYFPI